MTTGKKPVEAELTGNNAELVIDDDCVAELTRGVAELTEDVTELTGELGSELMDDDSSDESAEDSD